MDTLANMFSSMKNASMRGKTTVELPYSKMKESVLKVFLEKQFISDVRVFKEKDTSYKSLAVDLKYFGTNTPVISEIKRVSKPGLRIYKKSAEIHKVMSGLGFYVISTPRGVMSSDEARRKKLGGEVICKVY